MFRYFKQRDLKVGHTEFSTWKLFIVRLYLELILYRYYERDSFLRKYVALWNSIYWDLELRHSAVKLLYTVFFFFCCFVNVWCVHNVYTANKSRETTTLSRDSRRFWEMSIIIEWPIVWMQQTRVHCTCYVNAH